MPASRARVIAALLALYVIWGSSYLAMRWAIDTLPPFGMGAIRYGVAGILLYGTLRLSGARPASWPEIWAALPIGALLFMCGNGGVAYAQLRVPSGLAALVVASVPLWAAFFAGLLGSWPRPLEWLGLLFGAAGVAVLNAHGDLRGEPLSAGVLLFAAAAWALGSVWSGRLRQAPGPTAGALQMIWGGICLAALSAGSSEGLPRALGNISGRSALALLYLTVFGSLVAFSAYSYLLRSVRPSVATSYAFVNPPVALLLGAALAGEPITQSAVVAMTLILIGVALVTLTRPVALAAPTPRPS